METILAIDLETTGLRDDYHETTEIAAMLLDRSFALLDELHSFVYIEHPERGYERLIKTRNGDEVDVFEYTGISVDQLSVSPKPKAIVRSLMKMLRKYHADLKKNDVCLFGQNVKFDEGFLKVMFQQADEPWPFDYHVISLDSMYAMYGLVCKGQVPQKLSQHEMSKSFSVNNPHEHHALYDVKTSVGIARWMVNSLKTQCESVSNLNASN